MSISLCVFGEYPTILVLCMQELCAPAQVFYFVSLTNVPNVELVSPTGLPDGGTFCGKSSTKPATTLRSLINCTAHQKTAKLANTPVIAHLLRNLLYRSNNSRLCYLFAYNYCSLRYCGKQPKIKLKNISTITERTINVTLALTLTLSHRRGN